MHPVGDKLATFFRLLFFTAYKSGGYSARFDPRINHLIALCRRSPTLHCNESSKELAGDNTFFKLL